MSGRHLVTRSLLVPLYAFPSGAGLTYWNNVIAGCRRCPTTVIGNPSSGPGASANASYTAIFTALVAAGGSLAGYVRTDYANLHGLATAAQIKANIDKWVSFYPMVTKIFFDEQANGAAEVGFYDDVFDYAHGLGLGCIGNPGTGLNEAYLTSSSRADTYVVHENYGSVAITAPAYAPNYSASSFACLKHDASQAQMVAMVSTCRSLNIGAMFATDDAQVPNPWNNAPTYLMQQPPLIGPSRGLLI